MKNIAGRQVCDTVEELLEPASTALVLVDVQNDFVGDGGVVDQRGEGREAKTRGLVAKAALAARRARELGATVVYLRYCRTADHRFESAASLRWMLLKRGYTEKQVSAVEGTWGAEILDALAPQTGDVVIDKRRASGFVGTGLDALLREKGIRTVVFAGVSTHGCVEATARDAESHDYYVVVLRDCVGAYDDALHHAALTVMASRYEVIGVDALLDIWSRRTKRSSAIR